MNPEDEVEGGSISSGFSEDFPSENQYTQLREKWAENRDAWLQRSRVQEIAARYPDLSIREEADKMFEGLVALAVARSHAFFRFEQVCMADAPQGDEAAGKRKTFLGGLFKSKKLPPDKEAAANAVRAADFELSLYTYQCGEHLKEKGVAAEDMKTLVGGAIRNTVDAYTWVMQSLMFVNPTALDKRPEMKR